VVVVVLVLQELLEGLAIHQMVWAVMDYLLALQDHQILMLVVGVVALVTMPAQYLDHPEALVEADRVVKIMEEVVVMGLLILDLVLVAVEVVVAKVVQAALE
jgi:hypothetical protein